MTVHSRLRLRLPIVLAVVIILMLVALTVGWVILAVQSALESGSNAPVYWIVLSVGATFFVLIVVGVVVYLTLSIKAINLSRRQSNFIDSVTHELKSPIASLKLYLQTLTRHQPTAEERLEFYVAMLDDVERLDQLINHVLDAARLDRPGADEVQAVALDELLLKCKQSICSRYRLPESTIEMNLRPCTVNGRPPDLELIFGNLFDNAVKYAGSPPQVAVTLDKAINGRIRVCIRDNGQGIPSKFRDKIFGRFVRLGTELERQQQGLGLGLYIVRTLVGRLRGRVRVRGREDGQGSTFEVLLPGEVEVVNTVQSNEVATTD